MIQVGAVLHVADNSGAKRVACINVLGGGKTASIGSIIVVAVKKALPIGVGKVQAGKVYRAVVVRVKKRARSSVGVSYAFDDNAVVMLDQQGAMFGSRVFGPVGEALRAAGFFRIISLANEVL